MAYNKKEEKEYKINSFSDILDIVEGVTLKMEDFSFTPRPTTINVNWTKFSEQILNAGI